MRSFLVCLLVCFPAVSAFAGPADIRKLGDEGTLQAAQELVRIWDGHGRAIAALRAEWSELQRKRDETRIKLRNQRDPRKEAPLRARLKKIDAKIPEVDGKLATLELERAAVLDGLARIKDAEALGWLAAEALRKMRDPALRQAAAMAIARSKRVGPDALLAALGASKKPEMVVPLLQALGRHGASAQAVPALTDYLKHRDWSVRVAAAFALAATASPQGVEPVVAAMERTKKDTRERRELAAALTRYTGQKHGPYPDAWRSWWNANRKAAEEGKLPLGKGARAFAAESDNGTYYGIPQVGRIIYVVDVSGSMEVSMKRPRWIDGEAVPARDDEDSRFDAALRETLRAMRKLRPKTTFAVVLYSSHVQSLTGTMLPATKENRAKVEEELAYVGPGGSTNIYAALDHALRLAGVHPEAKSRKQFADAIYLVSDGSPTNSDGKNEDPERTLAAVRQWNALRKVAIHTIGIGKQHNRGFLTQLAEENGGKYYAVGGLKQK